MMDRGYEFPLYSFELLPPGSPLLDEARYALPIEGGLLTVAPALRRRAMHVSTGACEDAVALALSRRRLCPAGFAALGFDDDWARGLRHWRDQMVAQHCACVALLYEARGCTAARRQWVERGRHLWGRLSLAARLAGLPGAITRGAAPWRRETLAAALGEALARAQAHGERLARHGVGPDALAEIAALLAAHAAGHGETPEDRLRRERAQGALVALRAALLGDVSLLARAASEVLSPQQALPLRRRQLLGRRR